MAKIKSTVELEAWLRGQGRPPAFAQAISLRVALRVLPLAISLGAPSDVCLAIFRATSISWTARISQTGDMRAAAYDAANNAAHVAGHPAYGEGAAAFAAYAAQATQVEYAPDAAVVAVYDADAADAATHAAASADYAAVAAAHAAVLGAAADGADIWLSVSKDVEWLNNHFAMEGAATELAWLPLWLDKMPRWATAAWAVSKMTRADVSEGWAVWIEWYERRLHGWPTAFGFPAEVDEKFAIELALESNDFWGRSPNIVNRDIATRLDRARQVAVMPVAPTQSRGAPRFQITPDDRIDFASHDQDWLLEDTPSARTRYAELLKSLKRLGNLANQFDENIAELVAEFGEAVPDEIPAVDPDLFFARFNRLRRFLEGHRARVNSCRLSDDVAFALEGLRDDGNLFLAGQPKLLEIQSLLPNPVSPQVAEQRYRRIEVVLTLNAQNSQVTSPAAGTEVVRAVEDGKAKPDTPIDQAARAQGQLTQKNFLYALIEKLVTVTRSFRGKVAEGAAKKLGEQGVESGEKFIEDMAQNSDDIVKFVEAEAPEYASWLEGLFNHWL